MADQKLVLIDGNSIAYRAFFALPLLNNDKGIYTNGVYGFTMMLMKILDDEKPSHILVAFDAGKTTFRHKTFTEYKGTRQKTPSELSEQFPFIREVLDAFQIPRYELEEFEADDIIGTLSKRAKENGLPVKVYTGDKDLLQLVTDDITVLLTRKGITDVDTYTVEEVDKRYGITPKQIIDMKALMGDSSDNIPGVPGVGEKTALKLLHEFRTVDNVLDSIEEISGKKLKERLNEHKEKALMSKELATIEQDAPVQIELADIKIRDYKTEDVLKVFKDLGFNSLLERIDGDIARLEEELAPLHFDTVQAVTEAMLERSSALVVEVIEDNYHGATIQGFGVSNGNGNYYLPTEVALNSDLFKSWLEDEKSKKTVFDAKKAIVALHWNGLPLNGIDFDLLLASYLVNPADSTHDLSEVARRKGKQEVQSDEAIYGKGAKRSIPAEKIVAEHVVRKAHQLLLLKDELLDELKENNQLELFEQLELPLALILAQMEIQGVAIDSERLKDMATDVNERLQQIEKEITELAGESFNINSPKQLGEVLFERLGLPVIKKTKTGYSTSADILEQLQGEHPIIEKILHYRQLGKLHSTYIEGLLKVIHPETEKIHTRFNQALTQTGRLSSTDPNLQNIPIRLEEGRKIRQAFVPSKEEWVIFAADYSQIELRVLAHISKDERLVEAFQQDMDIHTKTAMDVFHVSKEEVTSIMRRQAKAVNFGIVYGISDFGLSQNLGISRKEAKVFIDQYFTVFKGVKDYMETIINEAKRDGYVSTLLNRRRYLPDITNRNFNKRSFAERTAMNTPIQGSAADIIKLAMIQLAERLEQESLQAKLLLQVHDELILEAPKKEIQVLEKLIPEVMEKAIELNVPLKVDYQFGSTWYDAK